MRQCTNTLARTGARLLLCVLLTVELITSALAFTSKVAVVPVPRQTSTTERRAPGTLAHDYYISRLPQQRRHQQPPRIHAASASLMQRCGSASKTGGTLIESEEAFAAVVAASEERPVLAFFTAPWCGPCRLSVPVVKDVMKQFAGKIDCCEICTDDLPDVASDSGVVSIPTIHLYCKGENMYIEIC